MDTAVTEAAMVVAALSRGLAEDRLVVDPDVLAAMSHDEAEWAPAGQAAAGGRPGDRLWVAPAVLAAMSHDEAEWAPAGKAAAGVRARSEAEVQHVVRVCAEFGAAVAPRGAGCGLSGGANAVDGCVVLDLGRMDRVVEIDRDNLLCVVQPGLVNNDL